MNKILGGMPVKTARTKIPNYDNIISICCYNIWRMVLNETFASIFLIKLKAFNIKNLPWGGFFGVMGMNYLLFI